ncbi:MAG: acyl-ACP--UDP-N-acetylglucosamine O-acyltransferase [Planctomycetes bacterium]|nr:acyl-ACP--UDP-N-acetylglucosamine O-acyltransferase [Planctomycetota bacterium]
MKIDKTAYVHPDAELADDVVVGRNVVIDGRVKIGGGTTVGHNTIITGRTTLGKDNRIFANAVVGSEPQDLKFKGEDTELIIGDGNVIREFVTINTGTAGGGGKTVIGNNNFLMACSHVAHDCHLEDAIVMANAVLLGGHVKVESHVVFAGAAALHHYVRVGRMAFVGGLTSIVQDVAPYMLTEGERRTPCRVNEIGLRRNGLTDEDVEALKKAHRVIYRSNLTREQAFEQIENGSGLNEHVAYLIRFLRDMAKGPKGRYLESMRKH